MLPPGLLVTSQGSRLTDLPLRAAFSPPHPLACRDMPLALARASRDRALREHRRSSASTPPLRELSLPLFHFQGQPGRSSIARVERAHSYRARSASRRTTRLPYPLPIFASSEK